MFSANQSAVAKLAPAGAANSSVRAEVVEIFRNGSRDESERRRMTHRDVFDRLVGLFGLSPESIFVSSRIASNLASLIGERDPVGWRYGNHSHTPPLFKKAILEYEEFERKFYGLARKFLPIATEMRDCQPVHFDDLDELVKALEPFAYNRRRASDPRSEWHATARFFAERIEAHFKSFNLKPPTRNSARGPLLLAVQSLLEMVGQAAESEAIRKVLRLREKSTDLASNSRFNKALRSLG